MFFAQDIIYVLHKRRTLILEGDIFYYTLALYASTYGSFELLGASIDTKTMYQEGRILGNVITLVVQLV